MGRSDGMGSEAPQGRVGNRRLSIQYLGFHAVILDDGKSPYISGVLQKGYGPR